VTFTNSQSLLKINRINQFPKVKMEIGDFQVREVAPRTTVTNFKWRVYPTVTGAAFHDIGSGVYVLRR
jgi:hypothetical protein